MKNLTIVEWFDPKNPSHIAAYNHLRKTGFWIFPEGVDTYSIDLPINWQIELAGKLANSWVDNFDSIIHNLKD